MKSASPHTSPHREWLAILGIIVVGTLAFWPALGGHWVWDDQSEFTDNAVLRDPDGWWKVWVSPVTPDYFPLKTTLQWVMWRWWGDDPLPYHLVTLGFHLLGAGLFMRVLRKLGVGLPVLGGLLFAVHPIVVESVAWNAELKNTMSLPLLLLAVLGYLDFDERLRARDYVASVAWFTAAMLCKSSIAMLPCVLLLHAWWRRGRISWRDVRASSVFFVISLVLGLVTIWFQHERSMAGQPVETGGFGAQVVRAVLSLGFYFAKSVLPVGLTPVYPRRVVELGAIVPLIAIAVVGALAVVSWRQRRTWGRHVLFGLGFFVLNLVPVLGLVPMNFMRYSWVADHFVYVSLLGIVALETTGIAALFRRQRWSAGHGFKAAIALAVILVGLMATESFRHARIFRNDEALWTYVLVRNPQVAQGHYNLGLAYQRAGRTSEALAHFEEAVRLDPRYPDAHNNLGSVLVQMGEAERAQQSFEAALRLDPRHAAALGNLGSLLAKLGRVEEARAHLRRALEADPAYAQAHYNLAVLSMRQNDWLAGLDGFEEALRLDPEYADARFNLAQCLIELDRDAEAIAHLERVLRTTPEAADAHFALGRALAKLDRWPEAVREFETTLQLVPEFPGAAHALEFARRRL